MKYNHQIQAAVSQKQESEWAVRFTIPFIYKAEKKEQQAKNDIAGALWVLMISSVLVTILTFLLNGTLLRLLGADGELLALGEAYITVITLGASTQVIGTGFVPFVRNHGGSMLIALVWLLRKKQFTLSIPFSKFGEISVSILKIGIAPFGLTMSPNISLIIINRFSVSYGGEPAASSAAKYGLRSARLYYSGG